MFRFWSPSRASGRRGRRPPSRSSHAIMSISARQPPVSEAYHDSLASSGARAASPRALVAEYLARTARLVPLFSRLHAPHNLALELSKSILYENADSIDKEALRSISGDSLWHGKPQQYFESMNYADGEANYHDSLVQ